MTFSEWSNKKKKKEATTKTTEVTATEPQTFSEWSNAKYGVEDIAPVLTTNTNTTVDDLIAVGESWFDLRTSLVAANTADEREQKLKQIAAYEEKYGSLEELQKLIAQNGGADNRTWFQKGAFEDGYQFGDVTATLLGSVTDVVENAGAGIIGMGEKALDALLWVAPYVAEGQYYQSGGIYQPLEMQRAAKESFAAAKKGNAEIIEKDLYNEEEVAKAIISNPVKAVTGIDAETDSVFGEKSDALVQSAGQLGATVVLQQAVGVPWFVTSGVTSFGSEAENALQQGATMEEAGLSAAITAGAEILTEKISGGIKFGGKTLDDALTKQIARGVSDKVVRTLTKLGLDAAGEGLEEVLSGTMSAVGQKITYADDKELSELFSSDEALESFIGGAVLGGGRGSIKAIKSNKNGVDYVTGLTTNEQAVVDKVYKDAVAEAEKNGKVTQKQKTQIYNEVLEQMKKGYISTDTIEEVLGGETYKTYKDTVDSEDALKAEFETLNKMKQGEMTGEQIDRRNELKQQLKDLETTSQRNQLKTQLSDEVFGLAKDSRLVESYNEKARRGQAFEADLSQYDAKQQETIKKAIESGILNDTRRTHEFVDMVAKISADKGVLFDFTNNQKLKESSFAVDGKFVNGYFDKKSGTIGVNIDSAKAVNTVVGHEITHVLEGTEFYDTLRETIVEYAKSKGDYQARIDALNKLYDAEDVDTELVADLVGDYLFTDSDFIHKLSTENRNIFQKIYDEIKYLCKVATAGSKEARELERVKKAFEDAYRAEGKTKGDTKYSISDKNIKDVSTGYASGETYFTMSYEQDGKIVGTLEYGEYDGEPNVKMIEVEPEYRRKGIATKLLQELQKKYPDAEIDFGMTTDDGTKLLDSITYDVTDEAVVADRQKLKDLQAELDELQEKLDVLYDTENLTEEQDAELHRLGDRWQEVYETINKLAKELRGKRAKKTFVKYSLSDSDGKQLSKEQQEYFKDSKMRDENGNLKVMYHGSQDAGFHIFDSSMSDDGTSFFFVDRNDVAASYSGTSETYEARTFRTAEDINKFFGEFSNADAIEKADSLKKNLDSQYEALVKDMSAYYEANHYDTPEAAAKAVLSGKEFAEISIKAGLPSEFASRINAYFELKAEEKTARIEARKADNDIWKYKVVEGDGKFTLLYKGDRVADSDTAQGIYEEFCWYEGVGDGDANYKVYLNLTNPLVVDAEGRNWDNVSREFSQEIADRYHSLTAEEKAALHNLAEWGEISIFRDEIRQALANTETGVPGTYDEAFAKNIRSAYEKLGGNKVNMYDLFSIAEDNFSDLAIEAWAVTQMNTRDYAQKAKAEGYDGVIFKNIVDVGGYGNGSEGASTVAIAFDSNQIKSTANAKPTEDADIRYSLGEEVTDAQNENGLDAKSEVTFSLSHDTAYMDNAISMNNSSLMVDSNVMAETKALRERIAARINAIKDRGLVGLPEDREGDTYIANSSYDGTEENTTICPRSLASEAFTDAVSEYLGRPLTVEEQIYISQDLQGRSLTPECTYCYVATDRKAYRAFLGEYIKQRDSVIQKLQENPNADVSKDGALYNEFLNGRKPTEPMYKRFKMWVDAYRNGTPMVEASHLANINKLMGDINSEFGEALKPQIVDAMKYAQSASWAKKRVNYVAYNGHILKWKQDRINKLNSHYGLRMYSFSDFHPAFVLENMQMITDASVRGLKMLGYTKDTDFVEIFAPSGMNINVSTFGFESGGNVYENNLIGAEWEKAKALREQYPNVGVTFVATNDTLVNWALEQDWIDVVIPYHLVRTGAEVAKAFNYTNYTSESADTKTKEWAKGDKKSIAPTEHNNDKATYLAALAKNHLKPRFERFIDNPNYMKLVNECRQPASVSKPVQPVFSEDAAMVALAKLEANGYYQPIGGSVDRMYEIAAEVAEDMTQELAPAMSLSEIGEQPKQYGSYNVYGKDIALETVQKDIAPTEIAEETAKTEQNVPIAEDVSPVVDAETTRNDLAAIAKQARRENFRGAYTLNGKQYLSDGSFIAEFNTVDESLEQSNDFPIKQATKELDESFARQVEGNYDLHTSDTKGFVKVGNSLFGTKRINALIRAFENPVFSLANVRGGHEALIVTADNGRAVLMPVRASGNAYLVYEAQPVADVAMFPGDLAPAQDELGKLYQQREALDARLQDIITAQDREAYKQIEAEYAPVMDKISKLEAAESERFDSLVNEEAPPEREAPYYDEGEPARADDPFEDRDWYEVGNRKVKAYMYENPEVKPFFQEEALSLLGELNDTTRGERWYNDEVYYESGGEKGFGGVKRHTSASMEVLLDSWNMSYADIEKGLNAIIEDNGAENIAAAKKIEFMLNDRLLHGYKDFYSNGYIPPNQDYINLLNEKQIVEYSKEAFYNLVANADQYDPDSGLAPVAEENTVTDAPVAEKYEDIKPKREPSGEPRMVRADSKGKQRKWVKTSTESDAVDGKVLPDDLDQTAIHYQPISNKKTLGNANTKLDNMGYEASVVYFNSQFANKKVSLDDIALGERLIQEAVKQGDTKTAGELIQNVAILGTELGQKVQALSIIKRLTPEGQLRMLQKTVERGKTKGDKAFDGVEVTQEMIDKILSAYGKDGSYDQAYLNAMIEDVKQKIADQMSVTQLEKVNAWRYLSMLGNPKTHIRNLVSNVAMRGTVAVKNALARTIEDIAPIENRTKTWKAATEDVKAFAQRKAMEMKDVISGDSKYSESASIKEKRATFKNKILNGLYEFNSDMLTKEDWWFSKPAFTNSLSEFLTANGINTEQDIKKNPKIVAKGINYATEQSQIATFRQYSWLANKINEIERKNAASGMAVGSILPFKKTPINIAKTGLNYSPLGFAKTLTYDVSQVKKGNMEASELVDHLAQNVTGSALTLVGYLLASSGFLNGAGDDDKEGKYDYQLGKQAYSINIGDATFSLSWLSPVAMPLFVGANAYEQLVEGKEWNGDVVVETLAQTLDPLSEMSFISSLDSVLSSYDSGIEKFAGIGETMAQNYITQFVPTLSSQIATVMDDTKRTTKVAADSDFKFFDETINNLLYKIPGLRQTLEPSTDIWGNEVKQTENVLTRAFETFLAPYAKREDIATKVDEEIKDLYSQTGDTGLIPSIPNNYISYDGEKYEMSAKEYTDFKKIYGQTAFDLMEQLFDTQTYQNADSETRADMVNSVYDYARDAARKEYFANQGVEFTNATKDGQEYYKENPIKGAIEKDMPVDEYKFSIENAEKYDFFKANGITYNDYATADEDGKRAYTWAFENPEKFVVSKAVANDVVTYRKYASDLYDIKADKDSSGKSISGSRKEKVIEYINNMDADYGQKIILFKSEYNADDTYNYDIIDYLNSREDISYEEMETILKELGFNVSSDGNISWD